MAMPSLLASFGALFSGLGSDHHMYLGTNELLQSNARFHRYGYRPF